MVCTNICVVSGSTMIGRWEVTIATRVRQMWGGGHTAADQVRASLCLSVHFSDTFLG